MSEEKAKVISYQTRFNRQDNQLYVQQCDFRIEKNSIDFNTCPIIADMAKSGIPHRFHIESITSVDVNLEGPEMIVPKSLMNAASICGKCELRHRER